MPKEYVDDCWAGTFVSHDDGEVAGVNELPTFRVKVGWNREAGDVQIATVNEAEHVEPFSTEAGLHVSLDRRGINDLIRNLRRARDQAFGRDE